MVTKNKVKLPENYQRSFSVTARHIENGINAVKDLLTNKRKNKITEKIIYSLNDEIKSKILELINLIRIKNETMFYELELKAYDSYEERIVRSNIGHIWTLLCDSTPESLKGYGDISNQQADSIRLHVNSLLKTIDEIQSIIK